MKCLHNNRGIALVTAITLSLIALIVVMGILYLITEGTHTSGSRIMYNSVVDASNGGAEIIMQEIIPKIVNDKIAAIDTTILTSGFSLDSTCLKEKITKNSAEWLTSCSKNWDPRTNPDFSFKLRGAYGHDFKVYSKIVDTVQGVHPPQDAPYSRTKVTLSGGGGVSEKAPAEPPPTFVYTLEISAEKASNPIEQGNLTVVYEY